MITAHGDIDIAWLQAEADGYKTVAPTPAELTIARRVHAFAVARGRLNLPKFYFRWVVAKWPYTTAEPPYGLTFHSLYPRTVPVFLKVGRPLHHLAETTFHELQHVSDARDPDLTPDEPQR